MFESDRGTYFYFVIINSDAHLIEMRDRGNPNTDPSLYEDELNDSFMYYPNWEAVGTSALLEFRDDRNAARAYVSAEILYDHKMMMKPFIIDQLKEEESSVKFEWVELPSNHFEGLQDVQTFERGEQGQWEKGDAPVERAIFASNKQSDVAPKNLGNPGGPCQVIKHINEEDLPDHVKDDLKQDVYQGEDLANDDAAEVYGWNEVRFDGDLISHIKLTNHVQYRMDLRSISVESVKAALHEFERWYKHKQRNKRSLSFDEMDKLEKMTNGESIRFEADKTGLTLIFAVERSSKAARLISTWWEGKPDPNPPQPGECRTPVGHVLGRALDELKQASALIPHDKQACGCDCPCDQSSSQKKVSPSSSPNDKWYSEKDQGSENWYDDPDEEEFHIRTEDGRWE